MKNSKKMLLLAFSTLALTVMGSVNANPKVAKAATVDIGSVEDFINIFNRGAQYSNHDINLTKDIDVSSWLGTVENGGQAGMPVYNGTFNGNGHIITGIGATGKWGTDTAGLFYNVSETATIKNLIIDWSVSNNTTASIGYSNKGTCENVTVITHVDSPENSFGAFFVSDDGGTYINCNSHYIINAGMGGNAGAISAGNRGNQNINQTNCNFSRVANVGAAANDVQGLNEINVSDIYANSSMAMAVGESRDLGSITYGIPGTWKSSNDEYATVENGSIVAHKAGNVTITGTMDTKYNSFYSNSTCTIDIEITNAANVTGVNINESDVKVSASKTTTLTASLTGNLYNSVTWSSKNERVATVIGDGLTATVTGVTAGEAEIEVSVLSSNGSTYTDSITIKVSEFAIIKNTIPTTDNFNLSWEGTGLHGLNIDSSRIEGDMTSYDVTATSNPKMFSYAGRVWQGELYIWFNGAAPSENSGLYSVTVTLSRETEDGLYIYESTYLFDGLTYVTIEGTIAGNDAIGLGNSGTYIADFTKYYTGAEYEWSVDDDKVLELTPSTSNSVEVKGLKEGFATLTCKVMQNGTEYTATKTIEVVAVEKDVTEISLDKNHVELKEGSSDVVNLTFVDGTSYTRIDWSSNHEEVATIEQVANNDKTAAINAISVGSATITVTVYTESGNLTASVNVEVLEADKLAIYFVIPDNFVNLGTSGFGLAMYGMAADNTSVKFTDTGIDMMLNGQTASLYETIINMENIVIGNPQAEMWIMLCSATNSGARWGNGTMITTQWKAKSGVVITCEEWTNSATSYVNLGTEEDAKAAIELSKLVARNENGICDLINDEETLKVILDAYDTLSPNAKALVESMIDTSSSEDVVTLTQTIEYLRSNYNLKYNNNGDSPINVLLSLSENSSVSLIALFAILGLVAVSAYYFIEKKKLAK